MAVKGTLSEQAEYERGFIDGMQKQMQSSVDKAVNRMATPQQIEKLEAQLGEAVWNYGEAMRALAAEREACAQMVERLGQEGYGTLAIAAALRQGDKL
jgi:DNA anti-recombination protein RmuC